MGRKAVKAWTALTAAAVAVAAVLAGTLSYALAKYVSGFYDITASVSGFDVSSEFTYTDAWGNGRSYGNDLGTMKRLAYDEDGEPGVIEFTMTVTNRGDVPVDVTLTIEGDGYKFGEVTEGYAEIDTTSDASQKTLRFTKAVPAAGSASVGFTVTADGSAYGVGTDADGSSDTVTGTYSRELVFDVLYEQAEEKT